MTPSALIPIKPDEPRRSFIVLWMLVCYLGFALSIGQFETLEVNSPTYWLIVLNALVLPLLGVRHLVVTFTGRAWWLVLALAMAGVWHAANGRIDAVVDLAAMCLIMGFAASQAFTLRIDDLVKLFVVVIFAGAVQSLVSDINIWGLLPFNVIPEFGVWRVAVTPNIANSAYLALCVLILLTRSSVIANHYKFILLLAIYFSVFSFVRAVLFSLMLYLVCWFLLRKAKSRLLHFALPLGITIVFHVLIIYSPQILVSMQENPILRRAFLRGLEGLSEEDIFIQLYRPWLWGEHWKLFWDSPSMMGLGNFRFDDLKTTQLVAGLEDTDSVSILTRLLASYGLASLPIAGFLIAGLAHAARMRDGWACACFPVLITSMLQWGTVLHPTSILGLLLLAFLLRGQAGFPLPAKLQPLRYTLVTPQPTMAQ